jgi:ElaB/YqjD/DUF883 family membrane-anchored ribosome-binding protein
MSHDPIPHLTKPLTDAAAPVLQHLADETLGAVRGIRNDASALLNQTTEQASTLAQLGLEVVRDSTQQLRDKAQHASRCTIRYVEDQPVKAVLIAAASGAVLMLLLGLLGRRRPR